VIANPELELLLEIARRDGDVAGAIARVSDWDRALELLATHGLRPLLPADRVPRAVGRKVAQAQMQVRHHNELNAAELVRFSDVLQGHGVPHVAYKGAIAAKRYYGGIDLREYSDFDVLVASESLSKVDASLRELGYEALMYTGREGARNRRIGFEESWQAHSGAVLDLHWQISDAFFPIGLTSGELLSRAIPDQLPDGSVFTMCDEDHLIVLATHAARHFFERLEWVKTVGIAMTRPGLDWSAIVERVVRARCAIAFVSACRIAARFLAYPLPDAVLSIPVRETSVVSIVDAVERDLVVSHRDSWRLFDRRRDAMRRVLKVVFEPRITDAHAMPLPHAMRSAYYLLRPIRLAAKHIRLRLKK